MYSLRIIISSIAISEHTKSNAAVVQQVAQVVKHGFLIVLADSTKITQETAAVGHHLWKPDFLIGERSFFLNEITLCNQCEH